MRAGTLCELWLRKLDNKFPRKSFRSYNSSPKYLLLLLLLRLLLLGRLSVISQLLMCRGLMAYYSCGIDRLLAKTTKNARNILPQETRTSYQPAKEVTNDFAKILPPRLKLQ